MKRLIATLAIIAFVFTFSINEAAAENSKKLKRHACTEKCHDSGKCVLVHGERGHKCTEECKSHDKDKAMVKHACSSKCTKEGRFFKHRKGTQMHRGL